MFCSNCGSRIPDGSRFCSACGAKVAGVEMPETPDLENVSFQGFAAEKEEQPVAAKKSAVSFDWSEVKEESHKRAVPEVHSPWGNTGLDEIETNNESNTAAQERSRTMSFIEILKKEREEKAMAAEAEARKVTEREETPQDHSAFESAPGYYMPPIYEDVTGPVETPFEEPKFEAPVDAAPKHEASAFVAPAYEEPVFEPAFVAPAYDEFASEEPAAEVLPVIEEISEVEEEPVKETLSLDEELAAILEAGAGKPVAEDNKIDLFKEEEPEDIEDEYLAMGEFAEEPSADTPAAEEPVMEELAFEEPVFEEPVMEETPAYEEPGEEPYEEDSFEDSVLEDYIEDSEEEIAPNEEPAYEMPVVETAPAVEDDPETEIEALKRRLAELMGETVAQEEPEEVPKNETVADLDELIAGLNNDTEFTEEVPLVDPMPVEEEVPLVDPMPAEEEEIRIPETEDAEEDDETVAVENEEPAAEAPATDAMSVEELEKDLFGETTEEEVEAEATKKIDKFYTLYKKNEEFQRLLDEEYNKLQGEGSATPVATAAEEVVPTVKDVLGESKPVTDQLSFEAPDAGAVPVTVERAEDVVSAPELIEDEPVVSKKEAKAAAKAAKKAAKIAKEEVLDDEEESVGGTVLTVIAVVIAVLLVILLGIILVLNFAPDSAIALKIDSVIETITSYFSAVDATETFRL